MMIYLQRITSTLMHNRYKVVLKREKKKENITSQICASFEVKKSIV